MNIVPYAAAAGTALLLSCSGSQAPSGSPAVTGPQSTASWRQWGHDAQHSGYVSVVGQTPNEILANIVYDPFVAMAQAESGGDLLTHYSTPLVDGTDVFMEFKTGTYVSCSPPGSGSPFPCGPDAWSTQIWNVNRLHWSNNNLVAQWTFRSDWKPAPNAGGGLGGWEPLFHPALTASSVYVPGAGGTIWKVDRATGNSTRINPFGTVIDPNTYVAGPLTTDSNGNIYFNVLKLDPVNPWGCCSTSASDYVDIPGAWLVKISGAEIGNSPTPLSSMASYKTLIPDAPLTCNATFVENASLPWPPAPTAVPGTSPCGSQRPSLNIAPAIAPDGTIYTVSRAHTPSSIGERYSYVVALKPDLTLKWAASLRGRLNDGCNNDSGTFAGSVLPANGSPGGCRLSSAPGVDPATNEMPAGMAIDDSTSSPVVAPDGSVLYGAYTRYNYDRGKLFHFNADGIYLGSYDFGWDSTPAIYSHGGTYSIVIKDNHYDVGSYCNDPTACPARAPGPYYMTQIAANMTPEWQFQNTNNQSCQRNPDNSLTCVADPAQPNGFEWCINAPAIDANGNIYANSEDGNMYVIGQGGMLKAKLFTNLAIGAAYTPLAIGPDGRIYTQNDGHLFVIGL
jgi:hypothetical protein